MCALTNYKRTKFPMSDRINYQLFGLSKLLLIYHMTNYEDELKNEKWKDAIITIIEYRAANRFHWMSVLEWNTNDKGMPQMTVQMILHEHVVVSV